MLLLLAVAIRNSWAIAIDVVSTHPDRHLRQRDPRCSRGLLSSDRCEGAIFTRDLAVGGCAAGGTRPIPVDRVAITPATKRPFVECGKLTPASTLHSFSVTNAVSQRAMTNRCGWRFRGSFWSVSREDAFENARRISKSAKIALPDKNDRSNYRVSGQLGCHCVSSRSRY